MKTKCYCVYCKKHPLHDCRNEFEGKIFTGWEPGQIPLNDEGSALVDCLSPISDAFDELWIDPLEYEYPITAYGDGLSRTGIWNESWTLTATCNYEEYER